MLYSKIDFEGKTAILGGRELVDKQLQDPAHDQRSGLTLMISIRGALIKNFSNLREALKTVEPGQYYYPDTDVHVTVLSLISASAGFIKNEAVIDKFIEIVDNNVKDLAPFDIQFNGIIVSDSAVLVKGYYSEGLQQLRNGIRKSAAERGIALQERYQSISAHSTIARFKSKLSGREQFLAVVQKYNTLDIGAIRVRELELVIHDWYNSKKEVIGKFFLKG